MNGTPSDQLWSGYNLSIWKVDKLVLEKIHRNAHGDIGKRRGRRSQEDETFRHNADSAQAQQTQLLTVGIFRTSFLVMNSTATVVSTIANMIGPERIIHSQACWP